MDKVRHYSCLRTALTRAILEKKNQECVCVFFFVAFFGGKLERQQNGG